MDPPPPPPPPAATATGSKEASRKPRSDRKKVPVIISVHGEARNLADVSVAQLDGWRAECLAALPRTKKYRVLYADPPWAYQDNGNVEGKPGYPTVKLETLAKLPVADIAASTSVLFLWATNPLLPQALKLIEAWGFEYKTVFKVWLKRGANGQPLCGCGWWSRPSTEMVLVATRGGGYMKWKRNFNEPQEFVSARDKKHSQKPDGVREAIRNFLDVPSRIELFARSRAPGFDAWGLEIPGFFAADPSATKEGGSPVNL